MKRSSISRKGENGSVAIIGGSYHMHGAPIFSALSAEASGVDLIFPYVPRCHVEVTKSHSLNFITSHFRENNLHECDTEDILESISENSTVVIGPGLTVSEETQNAVSSIIHDIENPLVIDASALQEWTLELIRNKNAVITPHIGELGRMIGKDLKNKDFKYRKNLVKDISEEYKITVLLKGAIDIISDGENIEEIEGGNAGLTVGGTGDALAGLIAGLIAQHIKPFEACCTASRIIKRAATTLCPEKGYSFTTKDVIENIPHLLHTYS
ncbi:NAD(P)H-hydrate dehydratase [Candidatus Peribacteria bacterium]|nr:NAD(P)H-hydrate dehydratase [Candidatus Peribacteria bacterium]MBT4021425.1 NAD(P)H-hydrate dehydratase [Candidatus Peribacteria bacterium]MBT4240441.1 NAD(P)H-hydrate dehydratase [Candidatus Peribacteria bacterium]MBT4474523.1 NAD(P)H-hydrate dehydratase [Candidatus Peribacteria bacterium]